MKIMTEKNSYRKVNFVDRYKNTNQPSSLSIPQSNSTLQDITITSSLVETPRKPKKERHSLDDSIINYEIRPPKSKKSKSKNDDHGDNETVINPEQSSTVLDVTINEDYYEKNTVHQDDFSIDYQAEDRVVKTIVISPIKKSRPKLTAIRRQARRGKASFDSIKTSKKTVFRDPFTGREIKQTSFSKNPTILSSPCKSIKRKRVCFESGPSSKHKRNKIDSCQRMFNTPRPIILDGFNIAYNYGQKNNECQAKYKGYCDMQGVLEAFNYFRKKGHEIIAIVLPDRVRVFDKDRTRLTKNSRAILTTFENMEPFNPLHYATTRQLGNNGWRIDAYDDLNIFDLERNNPVFENAVIISNDNYRDLYDRARRDDNVRLIDVITSNILPFKFFYGTFSVQQDPLGRFCEVYEVVIDGHRKKRYRINKNAKNPNPVLLDEFLRH